MEGIFIRKKTNMSLILLLLCGIFFIALHIFLNIVDSEATSELLTFLVFGIVLCMVVIPFRLLNYGAYIRIENGSVHAKYHWFGRIDCNMDEIVFAMAQGHTLTILRKNGKRHVIMGVENASPLATYVRREIFELEAESPDVLLIELKNKQTARKRTLYGILGGSILMFADIFITVFLTGGRDLSAFSRSDWIVFAVMGCIEAATVMTTFYFAGQGGKQLLPVEYLKYRLKGASIAFQQFPSGNPLRIFTDENYCGRIIEFAFPNGESKYYCVQKFLGSEFRLDTVHTSECYEGEDAIPDSLIDITKYFKEKAE